jgi:hypothetical protein
MPRKSEGRLNLAQDAILGTIKADRVPEGRLKATQDAALADFSRPFGTTRTAYGHPGLASWAKFSRPFRTFVSFSAASKVVPLTQNMRFPRLLTSGPLHERARICGSRAVKSLGRGRDRRRGYGFSLLKTWSFEMSLNITKAAKINKTTKAAW